MTRKRNGERKDTRLAVKFFGELIGPLTWLSAVLLTVALIAVATLEGGTDQDAKQVRPDACGDVTAGLQLCMRTERRRFGPCEPIRLYLSLKNVSSPVCSVMQSYLPIKDYTFELTDESSKGVPLTQYGQRCLKAARVGKFLRLDRADALEEEVLINRLYDMTDDGIYTIVARRTVSGENGKTFKVESLTVKVQVGHSEHPLEEKKDEGTEKSKQPIQPEGKSSPQEKGK